MTPEERAAQLPTLPPSWSAAAVNEACTAMILAAINRAVEAEREACAQVAIRHAWLCEQREHDPAWADKSESLIGGGIAAAKILAAIRARGVALQSHEISPKTQDHRE